MTFHLLRKVGVNIIKSFYKIKTLLYCIIMFTKYNSTWVFVGRPFFLTPPLWYKNRKGAIQIGDHFRAISKFQKNSIGVFQPVLINAAHPGSKIVIGNNVGISGATIKAVSTITIGNNVLIGSGALIMDNDSHPIDSEIRAAEHIVIGKPITIEDDVFIGARAIILKGVTIGKGAVIGSGSVVTKDVPAYTVAAGNPARIVKHLK